MFSKSNDYYRTNPVSKDDIKMYHDLILSDNPLPSYIRRPNHMTCTLYYLSERHQQYEQIMYQKIIKKLNINDELNGTNMILIFNIIEYSENYLVGKLDKTKYEYLLKYLERFSSMQKIISNYLLYKYYRGILLLRLNKYIEATQENMEIICLA